MNPRDRGSVIIPKEMRHFLKGIMVKYKGNKKHQGWGTLQTMVETGELSRVNIEKVKHEIENGDKTTQNLLGGQKMLHWVDSVLDNLTSGNEAIKDAGQRAGLENSHIKKHTKKNKNRTVTIESKVRFKVLVNEGLFY